MAGQRKKISYGIHLNICHTIGLKSSKNVQLARKKYNLVIFVVSHLFNQELSVLPYFNLGDGNYFQKTEVYYKSEIWEQENTILNLRVSR